MRDERPASLALPDEAQMPISRKADGPLFHELAVLKVIEEAAGVRSFELQVPDDLRDLFSYRAGQYLTFRIPWSGGDLFRNYSLSSAPGSGGPLTVTVKRVQGGRVSNWFNDAVAAGDKLVAMPPRGRFTLRSGDRPTVLIAAGSGITPVMSMLETVLAAPEGAVTLIHLARRAEDAIFRERIEALAAAAPHRFTHHRHLSAEHGRLTAARLTELVQEREAADFYICGPDAFMVLALGVLRASGVSDASIATERFHAAQSEPAAGEPGECTHMLSVRLNGRRREAPARAGAAILDSVLAAGMDPVFGCQAGACGACRARLVSGSVKRGEASVLTEDEVAAGYILTCQAIPETSSVEIDYDV